MVALRKAFLLEDDKSVDQNATRPSLHVAEYIPSDYHALIPFSYYDYIVALQAKRICTSSKNGILEISGLHNRGWNWQVPFVKCDSTKCSEFGQDAHSFCEYSFFAVSGTSVDDIGGRTRALKFQEWMYDRWPVLIPTRIEDYNSTNPFPFEFDFVQMFDSSNAMDDYIHRLDYGTKSVPKISFGIVFEGNATDSYRYWLRQNSTNLNIPQNFVDGNPVSFSTPPTNRWVNDFAKSDFETCRRGPRDPALGLFDDSCTGLYFYNGALATQRLVDDFILNQTGAADVGYSVADGSLIITLMMQTGHYQKSRAILE